MCHVPTFNIYFLLYTLYVRHENEINSKNHIKNWQLTYSPQNPVFDRILDDVSRSLNLNGYVGVLTSIEMKNVLFDRSLVAGIEFHHSVVGRSYAERTKCDNNI